jgi:hypothetical protein
MRSDSTGTHHNLVDILRYPKAEIAFDYRGSVLTSAKRLPVPEPSTWAMLLIGFVGMGSFNLPPERESDASRYGVITHLRGQYASGTRLIVVIDDRRPRTVWGRITDDNNSVPDYLLIPTKKAIQTFPGWGASGSPRWPEIARDSIVSRLPEPLRRA